MSTSRSAYARHRRDRDLPGQSLKAVQAAISSGRLDGALTDDGSIADVALADKLWEKNTRATRRPRSGPTSQEAASMRATAEPPPQPDADAELGNDSDAASFPDLDSIPDVKDSIARKEYYQAEFAKRKLEHEQGVYLEVAVVRRALERRIAISQAHLRGLPAKLASCLPRDVHRRIEPTVKQVIRQVLDEIADEERDA